MKGTEHPNISLHGPQKSTGGIEIIALKPIFIVLSFN